MTQSRIPGPLGQTPDADTLEARAIGLSLRPGRRAPQADSPPGPVGLHVWNAPIFAAPGAVAKADKYRIRRQGADCSRHWS